MTSFLTPATNAVYSQRIWWFVLGLAPFLLLVLRLSSFGRNANLAGGFAGRRLLVFVFFLFGLIRSVDGCRYTATVLCTLLAFITSTSVRTEPQATSAAPEEKKIVSCGFGVSVTVEVTATGGAFAIDGGSAEALPKICHGLEAIIALSD